MRLNRAIFIFVLGGVGAGWLALALGCSGGGMGGGMSGGVGGDVGGNVGGVFTYEPMVVVMPGEPARLADDIERAIANVGWGKLSVQTSVQTIVQQTAVQINDGPGLAPASDHSLSDSADGLINDSTDGSVADGSGHVTARALTPRGYTAQITATPTTDQTATVSIFVEPFGHRNLQRDFLSELRRVLAGPPQRAYRGDYRLPDQSPW